MNRSKDTGCNCLQRPVFMAAADFEAASCPRVQNEIKKTKLYSNTAPAADINTLLAAVGLNL